ncbi:MAG: regulatory protein RecX [Intestinibacillus sp.]
MWNKRPAAHRAADEGGGMDAQDYEAACQKALDAAAKQLACRALSQKQLRDKLLARGFAEDAADYAVAWLEAHGLLNDEAFAASVTRVYERRGYGENRIRQELRRRGVGRDAAEEALEQFSPDLAQMTALLDKRLHGDLSDRREVDKAVAALQRRGYRWDDIRAALRAYGAEGGDEDS